MDCYRDVGSSRSAAKPPSGKTMKSRAPPPPSPLAPEPAPRHIFRNAVPDGGGGGGGGGAKENLLRTTVDVHVTLPNGHQTSLTVDGSKALMDLLVELCSRHHLNPALHTLELLSVEGLPLAFKPNALLGSLDVARLLIKEKVWEDKVVRRPAPKVPEKTVRLVVNYRHAQKAVLRVNPLAPLVELLPAICDKCDLDPARVLLLSDAASRRELPLHQSLAQLGIKELYVHNQGSVLQPKMASAPALNYSESLRSSNLSVGTAEKRGFLGIFRLNSKKSKGLSTGSGVSEARPSTLGQSQSAMNLSRMSPKSDAKKRRAPGPPPTPMTTPTPTATSTPTPPGHAPTSAPPGHCSLDVCQMGLGFDSQQRKRKAPAAPPSESSATPSLLDDSSATPTPVPTPATRTRLTQATAVPPPPPPPPSAATPTPSLTSSCVSSSSGPSSPAPSTAANSSPAPSTTTGGGGSLAGRGSSSSPSSPPSSSSSSSSSVCSRLSLDTASDTDMAAAASDASLRSAGHAQGATGGVAGHTQGAAGGVAAVRARPGSTTTSTTTSSISSKVEEEEEETMVRAAAGVSEVERQSRASEKGGEKKAEPAEEVELRMDAMESNRHSAVVYCCGPVRLRSKRS